MQIDRKTAQVFEMKNMQESTAVAINCLGKLEVVSNTSSSSPKMASWPISILIHAQQMRLFPSSQT